MRAEPEPYSFSKAAGGCFKICILFMTILGGLAYIGYSVESEIISWKTIFTAVIASVPFAGITFYYSHKKAWNEYIDSHRWQ